MKQALITISRRRNPCLDPGAIAEAPHRFLELPDAICRRSASVRVDHLVLTEKNQQVLPTFAVIVGGGGIPFASIGQFNPAMLVHGE
jgi:hypothetical protein